MSIQFGFAQGTRVANATITDIGDLVFTDDQGKPIVPEYVDRAVYYDRVSKPKVQSRRRSPSTLASVRGLSELTGYNALCVVDTNTRVIGGKKVSAAGVVCCRIISKAGSFAWTVKRDSACTSFMTSKVLDGRVFTGDTLLIGGTGRTDFQNGDPAKQYDSLFGKLLKLADRTLVYPGHDYKGKTVSTIGEEKAHNPRLKVGSVGEYVDLMNGLGLPKPRMMEVAIPANLRMGSRSIRTVRNGDCSLLD